MDEYELVLLVKPEVFVFKIPPLSTNKGYRFLFSYITILYRAADWNLNNPDWIGRLRLVSLNNALQIRLEDKTTGFADRGDSFDLNVSIQDFYKSAKKSEEIKNECYTPKLDLGFKDGQTITKKTGKNTDCTTSKIKSEPNDIVPLLPPPPSSTSGNRIRKNQT